ncbi:MAG: lysophospholipid acyltransferase family protein, partial [Syntrophales bacterium]|nr:lysophospholipid acyltransferase family protein [Syntrophales bacterium]
RRSFRKKPDASDRFIRAKNNFIIRIYCGGARVDLEYLNNIKLVSNPLSQRFIARMVLLPNYEIVRKVDIVVENMERIPLNQNVIFAMNHTDRFNYWPFQYRLWRLRKYPFTTVWVKGKYYRNAILARALDLCNLIPVPSMGYLIEEFYTKKYKRRIDREQYRIVRDTVDAKREGTDAYMKNLKETVHLFGDSFVEFLRGYYEKLMARVAELSLLALFEKSLSVIVFPEGTRGSQLGEGRTGIAQLALHTGKTVIPVGCNYSDSIYPGSSPFAKSGRVVYRVGKPITLDNQLKDFRIMDPFGLLSRVSQNRYGQQFEGATRVIMDGINALLDEPYRKSPTGV